MNVVYHPVRLMFFPLILTGQVVTLGAWNINTQGYTSAFADAQAEAFVKLAAQLRNSPAIAKAIETKRLEETMAGLPPEESSLEAQVTRLSAQFLGSLGAAPPRRIAMAGFTPVSGPSTQLEAFLAEELTTRLVIAKPHTVVERSLLDKAFQELRLNQTDLVDPKHAKAFGRLTGADAVLVGSTADLGDQIRVAVRLVETETGTVLSAGSVSLFQHGAVKVLRSRPIKRSNP
jgi:TolB-like protein